jgi:hypothetical protein
MLAVLCFGLVTDVGILRLRVMRVGIVVDGGRNWLVCVVLLVRICRASFETLGRCQPNWLLGDSCAQMGWQFNAEGVEACVEIMGMTGLDVVQIGWVLVKRKLSMFMFGEDLRGDSMVCGRVGGIGVVSWC